MKRWLLLSLLALGCTSSHADIRTTEAIAYASVVADVVSTRYAVDRGADEVNPIYGGHPSNLELAGFGALRAYAIYRIARVDHPRVDGILRAMSMVTFGVAGNNVAAGSGGSKLGYFVLGVTIPLDAELIMHWWRR